MQLARLFWVKKLVEYFDDGEENMKPVKSSGGKVFARTMKYAAIQLEKVDIKQIWKGNALSQG